jgi:hypothetical protein
MLPAIVILIIVCCVALLYGWNAIQQKIEVRNHHSLLITHSRFLTAILILMTVPSFISLKKINPLYILSVIPLYAIQTVRSVAGVK